MKLNLNVLRPVIRTFFAKNSYDSLSYSTDESYKVVQLYCTLLQEQDGIKLAAQDRIDIAIIIAGLFKAGRRLDIEGAIDALEKLQEEFGAVISLPGAFSLDGRPIMPDPNLTPNGVAEAIVGFNNGVFRKNVNTDGVDISTASEVILQVKGKTDPEYSIFVLNEAAFLTLHALISTACQTYAPVRVTESLDSYFLDQKRRSFCLPAATDTDDSKPVLAERLNPATIVFLHKIKSELARNELYLYRDNEIIAWCLEIQSGRTTTLPEQWAISAGSYSKARNWDCFAKAVPLAEWIKPVLAENIRLSAAADTTVVASTVPSAPALLTWVHDMHTAVAKAEATADVKVANTDSHDEWSEVDPDLDADADADAQAARPSSRLSQR